MEESDLGLRTFGEISQARDSLVHLLSLAIYRKYGNCFARGRQGLFPYSGVPTFGGKADDNAEARRSPWIPEIEVSSGKEC